MKKITLFCAFIFTGIVANAQTDPLEQYLFKSYLPSLVSYDSISVSLDTGANFYAERTASMHYMSHDNSLIDTCNITDMGSLSEVYKGFYNSGRYELAAFDPAIGTSDTMLKYVFHRSVSGEDSVVEIYDVPDLVAAFGFQYNNNGYMDKMHFMVDQSGTGNLDTMMRAEYYYSTFNGPDSILQIVDMMGFTQISKMLFYYQGNRVVLAESVSDTSDFMSPPSYAVDGKMEFKHNSQGEIIEVHDYDVATAGTYLMGVYRYDIRSNSTIGLNNNSPVAFSLYPNPADDFLKIQTKEPIGTYEILSVTGQLIDRSEVTEKEINIQDLKTGSYLLRLEIDGKFESLMFQKK